VFRGWAQGGAPAAARPSTTLQLQYHFICLGSMSIISVTKSWRTRWTERVSRIGATQNVYGIVENLEKERRRLMRGQ
jgi:hypothetical protein